MDKKKLTRRVALASAAAGLASAPFVFRALRARYHFLPQRRGSKPIGKGRCHNQRSSQGDRMSTIGYD